MTRITCKTEILPEGDLQVARCPELNVSNFGDTIDEVRDSLQEAVEAFLEGCELLGTLDEVLEKSGYENVEGQSRLRERILEEATAAIP